MRTPLLLPLCFAVDALAIALLSQYGFGTYPCDLCIMQRYPYGVVIAVASIGLLFARYRTSFWLWFIIIAAFMTTAGTASYHFGVEQGWVTGPDSCSTSSEGLESLDALKAQILGAALVSCADVGASFLGLSMAGWNALYATFCTIITFILYKKVRNESTE